MKKFKFFGLGALLGAIGALLFAPKSGKELRADIKQVSQEIIEKLDAEVEKAKILTKEKYMQIVSEIVKTYHQAEKIKQEDLPQIIEELKAHWQKIEAKLKEEEKNQNKSKK